jgi:cell division protein FtsN
MTRYKSSFIITAIFVAWIAAIMGIYTWVSVEQSAARARLQQEQVQAPATPGKASKP